MQTLPPVQQLVVDHCNSAHPAPQHQHILPPCVRGNDRHQEHCHQHEALRRGDGADVDTLRDVYQVDRTQGPQHHKQQSGNSPTAAQVSSIIVCVHGDQCWWIGQDQVDMGPVPGRHGHFNWFARHQHYFYSRN